MFLFNKKKETGETAAKKPLKAASAISTNQIGAELATLVKHGGWNPEDAARVAVFNKQIEGADPSTAREMSTELKVIYKRNYNNLKKHTILKGESPICI